MKRSATAIGSSLFLAVAPGIVCFLGVPVLLQATFGREYDDYVARVPRWLPRPLG